MKGIETLMYFFKIERKDKFWLIVAMIIFCQFSFLKFSYAQLIANLGGQRAGVASFSFLKSDINPRAIGLGGAITTMKGDAYASQWNPAAMTEVGNHSFAVSTRLYPLGINHSFAAANIRLKENDYLAVSVNNLTSGMMEERTELQPNGTGQFFSINNMAIGLSYAKALTYRFSLGITAKYISEQMINYKTNNVAFDIGFIYKTDVKDLRFGVFLQNFGPNTLADGTFQSFSFSNKKFTPDAYPIPTVFKFGASMIPIKNALHSLTTSAELNNPNDNATNIRFGVEYNYTDILFFRAGYWINLPGYTVPSFGAGFRTVIKNQVIHINYAFASSNALGVNHNIGLAVIINNPKQEKVESE